MGNKVDIWEDETLKNIAKKHNKTLPQVVLNYFTSLNVVGKLKYWFPYFQIQLFPKPVKQKDCLKILIFLILPLMNKIKKQSKSWIKGKIK